MVETSTKAAKPSAEAAGEPLRRREDSLPFCQGCEEGFLVPRSLDGTEAVDCHDLWTDCFKLFGKRHSWLFPMGELLQEGKSDSSTCLLGTELKDIRIGEPRNQFPDSLGRQSKPLRGLTC